MRIKPRWGENVQTDYSKIRIDKKYLTSGLELTQIGDYMKYFGNLKPWLPMWNNKINRTWIYNDQDPSTNYNPNDPNISVSTERNPSYLDWQMTGLPMTTMVVNSQNNQRPYRKRITEYGTEPEHLFAVFEVDPAAAYGDGEVNGSDWSVELNLAFSSDVSDDRHMQAEVINAMLPGCLLYTSPSPRDRG